MEQPKKEVLPIPIYKVPNFNEWKIEFPQEKFLVSLKEYYFHELNAKAQAVANGKADSESLVKITAKLELIKTLLEQ